ncbi:hypothetical protein C8R44DRAFT_867107 [Mycena epipterygia]|nr:hypothetical protein C8R44DRAFT_867107 [Mycena epipterygia]
MPDWFAETLSTLAAYRVRQQIRELKRGFATMSQSNISMLDGKLFAGWIQFNEVRIPGCEFIDDAWSVDYRKVRGANLFDLMCIHHDVNNKVARVIIEKIIIEIMAAPGIAMQILYTEMGVDIELIDDAHPFDGLSNPLGAEQYGHQVPPGITTDDDKEVLIRHPIHPWRLSGESALQDGAFSHWTHPLLQGMRC